MLLSRGPLPTLAEGGHFRIHNGCGGAGCDECRGTGYATYGRAALRSLADRALALEGSLPPGWLMARHAAPAMLPLTRPTTAVAPTPAAQLAFAWEDAG